jgi:hypothetical protein
VCVSRATRVLPNRARVFPESGYPVFVRHKQERKKAQAAKLIPGR